LSLWLPLFVDDVTDDVPVTITFSFLAVRLANSGASAAVLLPEDVTAASSDADNTRQTHAKYSQVSRPIPISLNNFQHQQMNSVLTSTSTQTVPVHGHFAAAAAGMIYTPLTPVHWVLFTGKNNTTLKIIFNYPARGNIPTIRILPFQLSRD